MNPNSHMIPYDSDMKISLWLTSQGNLKRAKSELSRAVHQRPQIGRSWARLARFITDHAEKEEPVTIIHLARNAIQVDHARGASLPSAFIADTYRLWADNLFSAGFPITCTDDHLRSKLAVLKRACLRAVRTNPSDPVNWIYLLQYWRSWIIEGAYRGILPPQRVSSDIGTMQKLLGGIGHRLSTEGSGCWKARCFAFQLELPLLNFAFGDGGNSDLMASRLERLETALGNNQCTSRAMGLLFRARYQTALNQQQQAVKSYKNAIAASPASWTLWEVSD
jgi:hypothetical protein